RYGERRAARGGDLGGDRFELAHDAGRRRLGLAVGDDRIDRTLADRGAVDIDAADAREGREGNELRVQRRHLTAANAILLLGQHHDRATFRRLVTERGELARIGQLTFADAAYRQEFVRLAIADR